MEIKSYLRLITTTPKDSPPMLGLQAVHQYPSHFQALQILDGFRRRCVTVLDQDTVDLDQAVVVWSGVPSNGRMPSVSNLGELKPGCTSMIRRAWRIGFSEGARVSGITEPPDATKPALGGFCLASYLVGRGSTPRNHDWQ